MKLGEHLLYCHRSIGDNVRRLKRRQRRRTVAEQPTSKVGNQAARPGEKYQKPIVKALKSSQIGEGSNPHLVLAKSAELAR